MKNIKNFVLVILFSIFLVLGCGPTSKGFLMVRHGCITNDGSKIALDGFEGDFDFLNFTTHNMPDKYRLILDGKTGKVIWKDLTSLERLFCAEDNSILSVSQTGVKWIEGDKEIVFSKQTDKNIIHFIGMTDKDTVIREDRPYSNAKLKNDNRGGVSPVKVYDSFPTFLIDKLGENKTKIITLSEADLPDVHKDIHFNYYFEKNRIIISSGQKVFAVDVVSGKTTILFENENDFKKSLEKDDKYGAIDPTYGGDGVLEIYEGAKIVNKINKKDLEAQVIHIIDCCNNGLNLLYWENGNFLKVAQINHLTGKVIWKSDSLLSTDQK